MSLHCRNHIQPLEGAIRPHVGALLLLKEAKTALGGIKDLTRFSLDDIIPLNQVKKIDLEVFIMPQFKYKHDVLALWDYLGARASRRRS